MVADNQHDGAVRLYASGYYYHAKRKGMLERAEYEVSHDERLACLPTSLNRARRLSSHSASARRSRGATVSAQADDREAKRGDDHDRLPVMSKHPNVSGGKFAVPARIPFSWSQTWPPVIAAGSRSRVRMKDT